MAFYCTSYLYSVVTLQEQDQIQYKQLLRTNFLKQWIPAVTCYALCDRLPIVSDLPWRPGYLEAGPLDFHQAWANGEGGWEVQPLRRYSEV